MRTLQMNAPLNNHFWKWGNTDHPTHLRNYPDLKKFLEEKFNRTLVETTALPDYQKITATNDNTSENWSNVFHFLRPQQVSIEPDERLYHAAGKSYRNIIDVLSSRKISTPPFILYPESEDEVVKILAAATGKKIKLNTFSGGTSVVGSFDQLENPSGVIDIKRLNRLVELDEVSHTATFETGITGPQLERILNEKGFTLGHFPQSFEFSTLGGWIAMSSAGQESGYYGNIEDMLLWIKVITPSGNITTLDFPRHACGIDLLRLFTGSEGAFGIVTQAKVRIRKIPLRYTWIIALFKNFESGAEAVREMVQAGIHPAILRLSDVAETQMMSKLSHEKKNILKRWAEKIIKSRLTSQGFTSPCLLMMRFPVTNRHEEQLAAFAGDIVKKRGAYRLPAQAAATWEKSRFSLPYLRDTLIEHGVLVDTFETSTYWKNIINLYHQVKNSLEKTGYFKNGILLCHISHSYETGASLYFTMMTPQVKTNEIIQWKELKSTVSDAIILNGGAISHHHGIGKDHSPWYRKQLDPHAVVLLKSMKEILDPDNILNSGILM